MNKAAKEFQRKNNLREKEISKENEEIYTHMIVYLRTANLSDYNQEVVREDIINMILDGQTRGANIQEVIGENYKEVCDEIIAAMPKKTPKERLRDIVSIILNALWILGLIAIGENLLTGFLLKSRSPGLIITVGDLINVGIIILAAVALIYYVSKTSFEKMQERKLVSFFKFWLFFLVVISLLILSDLYLKTVVIILPMLTAAILVLGILLLSKVVDR